MRLARGEPAKHGAESFTACTRAGAVVRSAAEVPATGRPGQTASRKPTSRNGPNGIADLSLARLAAIRAEADEAAEHERGERPDEDVRKPEPAQAQPQQAAELHVAQSHAGRREDRAPPETPTRPAPPAVPRRGRSTDRTAAGEQTRRRRGRTGGRRHSGAAVRAGRHSRAGAGDGGYSTAGSTRSGPSRQARTPRRTPDAARDRERRPAGEACTAPWSRRRAGRLRQPCDPGRDQDTGHPAGEHAADEEHQPDRHGPRAYAISPTPAGAACGQCQ